MKVSIFYQPFGAMAKVELEHGEQLNVEPGAMIGMSTTLDMKSGMQGGFFKGVGRMFGGENFFQNTYTATRGDGELLLSQRLPGDIISLDVPREGLRIQSSSYIAAHSAVTIATKFSGLKTLFSGEGLFTVQATASGPGQNVILGSYGGITEMVCDGEMIIDSGHLVAWDSSLEFTPTKASNAGWFASFISGEGIVVHFRGQGRIWMQSRNPVAYGQTIGRLLPPR